MDYKFEEKTKYFIDDEMYFEIDDYDIRFYFKDKRMWFFEINTYPNEPSDILSKISGFRVTPSQLRSKN